MKYLKFTSAFFLLLITLIFSSASALAKSSELEFRAAVTKIDVPAEGDSIVTVKLFTSHSPDFEVPVIVMGATEIESNGYHIPLSELEVGDIVKVNGFFGQNGIVAKEIYVLDGGLGKFRLRGMIQHLESVDSGVLMGVLGIDILVDETTSIRNRGLGVVSNLPISALQVGEEVDVKGRYLDETFFADRVEVGKRPDEHVSVQGKIVDLIDNTLKIVTIHGANLIVIRNESTKVYGPLTVGEFIEVNGYLDQHLHIIAELIRLDDDHVDYSAHSHYFGSKKDDDEHRYGHSKHKHDRHNRGRNKHGDD